MSYVSLHKSNVQFEVTAILIVLCAAFAAMALMFIHPWFAILAFWLGLLVAASAGVVELIIRRQQRAEARKGIATHHCPVCDGELREEHEQDGESSSWGCAACGSAFTTDGDVLSLNA